MRLTATMDGRSHEITVERRDGRFVVVADGVERILEARKLEGDFYSIVVEGRSYEVSVEPTDGGYHVRRGAACRTVRLADPSRKGREDLRAHGRGPEKVSSVMPGKVVRVMVGAGDEVARGQGLVVVEAMKMENEIAAPRAGKVASVHVEPGEPVEVGAVLVVLE